MRAASTARASFSISRPAGDNWSVRGNHYAEVDHYLYYCGPTRCYAGGYAGTTRKSLKKTAESEVVCGTKEVDTLIREYKAPLYTRNDFTPSCDSFKSAGISKHFSWSQLNGGFSNGNPHRPWGIVTPALKRGLDHVASKYPEFKGIHLTSGYRCPHGNAAVGGVTTSSHMIGRAADLLRPGWTEEEFKKVENIAKEVGGRALEYDLYSDRHMHVSF